MSPEAAVELFMARGLLTPRDVVEGELTIEEAPGRNRNLVLRSSLGDAFFLKVASGLGAGGPAMLRSEAALYERVRDDAAYAALRPFLPIPVLFDGAQRLLATRVPPSARDVFSSDDDETATGLPDMAAALGHALAVCHTVSPSGDSSDAAPFLRPAVPWIFDLHRPTPDLLADVWPAQLAIVRTVQERADLCRTLDRLREAWRAECLIHGDVKFSNVVLTPREGNRSPFDVMLVDWETAALGDRAWDVGSLFQGYLWHCIYIVSNEDEPDPGLAASRFAQRLPAYQVEIRACWEAYVTNAGLPPAAGDNLLRRATEYCGARLLQTAYEHASHAEQPGRAATGLLQLAINVLARPKEAQRSILGIALLHITTDR